jgi:hypothetical protein
MYNENMLTPNGGIQPITSTLDYEKMGVTLFDVYIVNPNDSTFETYSNGEFIQLEKGKNIQLNLDKARTVIPSGNAINGLDIRMGFMENIIFYNGFGYSDKFVAKLFENGKLVGYCCVYYRNIVSLDE